MKNPFRRSRPQSPPRSFEGIGTVLLADIVNLHQLTEELGPEDIIKILKRHLTHMCDKVEKHSGIVIQFMGDAVSACWPPKQPGANHAQRAFDAACEMLRSLPDLVARQPHVTYDVDIVLGTGEMKGDLFGPTRQFQVVGTAMAVASRLAKVWPRRESAIRMSQYTAELLDPAVRLEETGTIARAGLADLRILVCRSETRPAAQ
ncbi:MAG: adenylate/guanylate cyclase domain-containing protein [Kiritimatiellae bacterium]|nr:adenylate/guanylate cyclase domain-containing protein [Kiritimatiellia bacterium]